MTKEDGLSGKKILLINPWIYDFAAYDLWVKPVGLLYLSSFLRKFGYETKIIDCLDRLHPELLAREEKSKPQGKDDGRGKFHREEVEKPRLLSNVPRRYARYGLPLDIFEAELDKVGRPSAVLITSMMTYWYPGVVQAIKMVKKRFPDVPVVLGGVYATLLPHHAKEVTGADFIIRGPGEVPALRLVDELLGRERDFSISAELDSLPYPDYDGVRVGPFLPILTSRGCPLSCSFCASRLLFSPFRQRDPSRVIEEIEYYKERYKIQHLVFYDDALLVNSKRHIEVILKGIIDRRLNLKLHTPNGLSPRMMTSELAFLMKEAGFITVRLSLETADPKRQKAIGGKVANEDFERALRFLSDAGFAREGIEVYLMMGLPGQRLREVVESIVYVNSLGAKVRLASYSPIPGTADWKKAVALGLIADDADPLLHNNTIVPTGGDEFSLEVCSKLRKYANLLNRGLDSEENISIPTFLKEFLNGKRRDN